MPPPIPEPEPTQPPRWVGVLALAAIAAGTALRFAWPADIEFKADEQWMFERALAVGRLESWSWSGMESSVTLANPGASVWAFAALSRAFGLDTPPALSMGVAACGVLSLLPLAAVTLWWCWWRRDQRGGALAWDALGMLMGQVHLSRFFLATTLAGWTRWRAGGPETRWRWWWAGTVVAALPLVPWALEAGPALLAAAKAASDAGAGHGAGGIAWWNVFVPRFWALWVTEPTGLLVYPLGEHFRDFLRWPVAAGTPTWLMAAASLTAWGVLGRGLWAGRRRLAEPARRNGKGTIALLGAALVPLGVLLTLTTMPVHRHYLIAVFPLPLLWFAGLSLGGGAVRGRRWLAMLVAAQLILSVGFLHYIHVQGGAPRGDYGVTWRMQARVPASPSTP